MLFVVQGRADRFLPDFHNDLEFARAFGAARAAIDYFPLALEPTFGADRRLRFEGRPRPLAIPWDTFEAGVADGGLYLLLLRLARARRLEAGASGPRDFPGGWYAYVGSARRGLGKRIERHLRRGKGTTGRLTRCAPPPTASRPCRSAAPAAESASWPPPCARSATTPCRVSAPPTVVAPATSSASPRIRCKRRLFSRCSPCGATGCETGRRPAPHPDRGAQDAFPAARLPTPFRAP